MIDTEVQMVFWPNGLEAFDQAAKICKQRSCASTFAHISHKIHPSGLRSSFLGFFLTTSAQYQLLIPLRTQRPDAFAALHDAHPAGRIGLPEEVAHLARYLIAEAPDFLNGSCLGLDGGIAGRLHDPV